MKTKFFLLFVLSVFIVDGQAAKDTLYIGYSKDLKIKKLFKIETKPFYFHPEGIIKVVLPELKEYKAPKDTIAYYDYLAQDSTRANHYKLGYINNVILHTTLPSVTLKYIGLRPNTTFKIYNYYIEENNKKIVKDLRRAPLVATFYGPLSYDEVYYDIPVPSSQTEYQSLLITRSEL